MPRKLSWAEVTTIRVWLVQTLIGVEGDALHDLTRDRVYPRESMNSSVVPDYPYLVIGLGNATNEELGDNPDDFDQEPERQFFQVWIHDKLPSTGGSYLKVDELIPLVKAALRGKSSPDDNIMEIKYLETSGEFSNETLGTVYRYLRFQAIRGKVKV